MAISEYTIDRQGKQFVLYAGLLAEFHGMKGGFEDADFAAPYPVIETELLQIPNEKNGDVAVVQAKAGYKSDGQWIFGPFSGIGDAGPQNVGRMIAPHLIRMAETRAKARALRDAVNVSEALADDESTEHEDDGPPPVSGSNGSGARSRSRGPGPGTTGTEAAERGGAKMIHKSQVDRIKELSEALPYGSVAEMAKVHISGKGSMKELTFAEGKDLINVLQQEKEELDSE